MDLSTERLFQDLAIALGLGLLVGLQREQQRATVGVRGVALVTVSGTLSGIVAQILDSAWIVAAPLIGIAMLVLRRNGTQARPDEPSAGLTTQFAVLAMFLVGVFLAVGPRSVGVAVGGLIAVLLQFKPELHGLARRIGDRDLRAVMQFVLISFVILPTLPTRIPQIPKGTMLDIVNPYEAWWLVVLIVGINLFGYAAYKVWGVAAGSLLNGLLGGLISSTATTAGYARGSRVRPTGSGPAAVVIAVASSVLCLRVLIEIAVVGATHATSSVDASADDRLLRVMLVPMLGIWAASFVPAIGYWLVVRRTTTEQLLHSNPTQLRAALVFAAVYMVILVALDAAHRYLPAAGPPVVAGLSGLTDMDAVTLSTARLVASARLSETEGMRLIFIAWLSNLAFKWTLTAALGDRGLLARVSLLFAPPALVAGLWLAAFR